nr:unnamed protein product [Callosobruchus chinensis]
MLQFARNILILNASKVVAN